MKRGKEEQRGGGARAFGGERCNGYRQAVRIGRSNPLTLTLSCTRTDAMGTGRIGGDPLFLFCSPPPYGSYRTDRRGVSCPYGRWGWVMRKRAWRAGSHHLDPLPSFHLTCNSPASPSEATRPPLRRILPASTGTAPSGSDGSRGWVQAMRVGIRTTGQDMDTGPYLKRRMKVSMPKALPARVLLIFHGKEVTDERMNGGLTTSKLRRFTCPCPLHRSPPYG